jgi:hypothetical protein
MNDSKRDRAHSRAMLLRLPAEIEIVEMKVESLVKPDAMLFERGFPDRKQYAVHELAFLPGRTIGGQLTWKTSAMTDNAGQIRKMIQSELLIHENPARLFRYSAFVAGDAQNIEILKTKKYLLDPEKIYNEHIIMYKNKYFIGIDSLAHRAIITDGQRSGVFEIELFFLQECGNTSVKAIFQEPNSHRNRLRDAAKRTQSLSAAFSLYRVSPPRRRCRRRRQLLRAHRRLGFGNAERIAHRRERCVSHRGMALGGRVNGAALHGREDAPHGVMNARREHALGKGHRCEIAVVRGAHPALARQIGPILACRFPHAIGSVAAVARLELKLSPLGEKHSRSNCESPFERAQKPWLANAA